MTVDNYGNERNWDNGYPGQYGDNLAAGVNMDDTAMSAQNKLNAHSWKQHYEEMDRILASAESPTYYGDRNDTNGNLSGLPSNTPSRSNFLSRGLIFLLKTLICLGVAGILVMMLAYGAVFYFAKSVPEVNGRNVYKSMQALVVSIAADREFHGQDISPPAIYINKKFASKIMTPGEMARYLASHSGESKYSILFLQSAYTCIYDSKCTNEFLGIARNNELTLLNGASIFLVEKAIQGNEAAAKDACIISLKRPLIRQNLRFARNTCAILAKSPTRSIAAQDYMNKLNSSLWFSAADRVSKMINSMVQLFS